MTKVAINGMGRIGRAAFKIIMDRPELELVAVNDLMDLDNLVSNSGRSGMILNAALPILPISS